MLVALLVVLLVGSLTFNAYQWHRWHSYRSRPSGQHSFTGMFSVNEVRERLNNKGATNARPSG